MATKDEKLAALAGKAGTAANQKTKVVPKLPTLPDDVRKRFPSLNKWESEVEDWRQQTTQVIAEPTDKPKTPP